MPRIVASVTMLAALVLTACGSTPAPSLVPAASPLPLASPAPSLAVVDATLTPSPTSTSTPTPTPSPSQPTASAATAGPTDTPKPVALTTRQKALVRTIRFDARIACSPRTDLPARAIDGVECHPESDVVARIGVYLFRDDHAAATTYFERLAEQHVEPNSGQCQAGNVGDEAWAPGDGEPGGIVIGGVSYAVSRLGCFVNADGTANFRATCGGSIYIGVLGRAGRDVRDVSDWAMNYAEGASVEVPSPPGVCTPTPGPTTPPIN
ncbi:MAG: hypothetical protein ACJ761_09565 [Chloroflexota bacterium]